MKSTLKSAFLLFHYWFPVALGWSVALVIHKSTGSLISPSGIHLYLFAILAAYSLDRLLDPPKEFRPLWLTAFLWVGILVSMVLGATIAVQLSIKTISVIAFFSVLTVFYHKAKRIPFLKTLLVAIVWIWAGVALAFQNQNWFAWQFWTLPVSIPLVILFAAGSILCDLKDLQSDSNKGTQSLPVMIGLQNTVLITSALLFTASVISYEQGRIGLVISGVALIGLAQFPSVLSLDAIGPLLVDAALAIPGLLISLHLI